MTPQQTIRAILDAATEGNLSKAEEVLEGYAREKAINFHNWCNSFQRMINHNNETTDELYSQSIKQQP